LTTLTQLAETVQEILTTKADELARSTGFVQRQRKVSGSNFAQTLVFTALADPNASESRMHATAALVGLNASRQAIDKRFNAKAAEFLRQLLEAAVQKIVATPVGVPLLRRFTAVIVLDSSTVALCDELAHVYRGGRSGTTTSVKAAVKLTVGSDFTTGVLLGPEVGDGRAGDLAATLATACPPRGGLQLADQNYFSVAKFAAWAREGAYWMSRFKAGTKVYDDRKQRIDLLARLRAARDDDVDLDVFLGSQERLTCRLIARRVPPDVAALRRQRLQDKCRARGNEVSAESLALCEWTALVTNVPRALLNVEEAMTLARMRWQIELIFKLWKSCGRIDEFRGAKPFAALCELFAKLLAQVIRHWMIVVGAWSRRDRSLTKAAAIVSTLALSLAAAIGSVFRLRRVLKHARQMMQATARMEKRRKSPNAHDLIYCLDPGP
jgi:hypothetical protein